VRRIGFILTVLLATTAGVTSANMDESVHAAYASQCRAIEDGSWKDFEQSLSPSYVGRNLDGPNDSQSSEAKSLRQMKQTFGISRCEVDIRSYESQDAIGSVVDVTFTLQGVAPSEIGTHIKKGDSIEFRFHSIDTWVRDGGRLLQSRAETKGVHVLVNGAVLSSRGTF
jgi:hypothetical protein